jgi:hypothetical protein
MVSNAIPAISSLQQVVSSINPPTYSRAVASRHMQNAAVVTRPQYYPNPNTMTTTSFISVSNSTRIRPNFSQMTPQQNSGSSSYLLVQQQAPKNHPYLQRMLSVQQQIAPVQQQIAPAPQVPPTQVVNPVASAASSQKPNASMDDDSNSLEIVDVVETPRVLSTFSLAEAPLQVSEPLPEKSVVPAPMQPVVLNTELIKPGDASNSLNVKALLALWSNPDFNTSSIFDDKGKCTVLFNECLNSICQCSICRIFFLNQAEYLLHLTTDLHGKSFHKFFPCYACKINFSSLQLLKEHHAMGLHGNARWQYSCSLCPLFSSKEENVLKHMIKSHCYCPHCHSYLQKLRHIQLSKKRSKLESHKCLVCGLLVNRHAALAMLKCIKESEMVYVCNFCSISVSSRELLTQHFLQNHSFVFNGKTMEPIETPNLVPHFLPYVAEGLLPILPTSPSKQAEKEIAQSDVPTTAINITAPTPEKSPPVPTPEKINSDSRSQRDSSESTESTESVPSIKVEKEDPPVREKKKTDPGSIQYCCHECPASFNQFGDLISHAKQSHTKEHLKCSNCNRNFASRDSLDTHKCRDTSGKMVLKLIKMEDLQN